VTDGAPDGKASSAGWRARLPARIPADFVSKVVETIGTRLVVIVIGMLSMVAVARALGPAGRGLYSVAAAVGAIGVQLGNLGLHASNTYSVARDRKRMPELLGNSLFVGICLGGAAAALAWVVFSIWTRVAPVPGLLLLLALLSIPVGVASLLLQNLLLGIHEVRAYNRVELGTKLLGLAFVGLALLAGVATPESLFSIGVGSVAAGLVWAFAILWRETGRSLRVSLDTFRETLRYGVKAYLAALFMFAVLRIDLLMVKFMGGSEQAGLYSIAVAMADFLYMVPTVVGTILFPRLSAVRDDAERWKVAAPVRNLVAGLMLFLTAAAALVADPVTRLLFGPEFQPAVPAFLALLPGIWLISINVIYMNYLGASGMPAVTVVSPGIAALSNVLLNLVLIPRWGIVGASVASSVCYGLMLLLSMAYVRRGPRPGRLAV
jgi:O-antigen/teichoic acid export membrane protein